MNRISVENLSKEYRIYERPQDRLVEILLRKKRHNLYHVLNNISFDVADGNSLGIIGVNGAGKSTLLKMLTGTLQPTTGNISIAGQVAALLELGAGFHPEFTGRKNIYLNASLLGVSDENIKELENDIIEFSELSYFIDRPVKTYSSGMFVRLAFSIATMVNPDVLIIDEALSVGDMAFQRKCVQRMNQFRADRKTMVFCSHSMFHIQELCDHAIWIHKGNIREYGDSDLVVGKYEDFCNSSKTYNSIEEDIPDIKVAEKSSSISLSKAERSEDELSVNGTAETQAEAQDTEEAIVTRDCRINSVSVQSANGDDITEITPLEDLHLHMEVEVLVDEMHGNFGFAFMKSSEEPIASFLTTSLDDVNKGPFHKGEIINVTLKVESISMRVGEFYVLGGVADDSGLLWYETKFSNLLTIAANRGVGPLIMKTQWGFS